MHTQSVAAANVGLPSSPDPKVEISGQPSEPPITRELVAEKAAEIEDLKEELTEKTLAVSAKFVRDVAERKVPFDPTEGNHSIKTSDYGYHLATHLAGLLQTNRKEVITLALCHYSQAMTAAHVTSLNDLALLTQGLQVVIQDMAMEVAEHNRLALEIANQEVISGTPSV